MEELKTIMEKFAASGWDLISVPAQQWLERCSSADDFGVKMEQSADCSDYIHNIITRFTIFHD